MPKVYYDIEKLNNLKPKDSRLLVISFIKTKHGRRCVCKCSCGKEVITQPYRVVSGHSKSCGCFNADITRKRSTKYFPVIRTIYRTYQTMIERCYNKSSNQYKYYGAIGVVVCDEWRNDYQKFLDWSLANGWREDLELDKDIKGDKNIYSPETCLWVTHKENCQSRRSSKIHYFKGKKMTVSEVSTLVGIPANVLSMRMSSRGRTMQQAVEMGPKSGTSGDTKYFIYKGEKLSLMAVASLEKVRYGSLRRYVNDLNIELETAIKKLKTK